MILQRMRAAGMIGRKSAREKREHYKVMIWAVMLARVGEREGGVVRRR